MDIVQRRRVRVNQSIRGCRQAVATAVAVLAALLLSSETRAQSQQAPGAQRPPAATARPRTPGTWWVTGHGGFIGALVSDGESSGAAPFPTGTAFATVNGRQSRAVPSWAFGDGAVLFDEVRVAFAAQHGVALPAIVPLDAVLRMRGTGSSKGPGFGGRVGKDVTSWLGLEFGIDRGVRSSTPSAIADGLENTRASYASAFQALVATIPQTGSQVTVTAPAVPKGGHQTVLTGNALLSVVRTARFRLHAIVGGGLLFNDVESIEAQLQGNYRFSVFSALPIDESDGVTVRFSEKRTAPVGVFGAGFTVGTSRSSGVRVDARILASRNTSVTTVDASPSRTSAGERAALPSNTAPSIQFSSEPSVRSTLSGDAVSGLETYKGSGLDLRPVVTVGYYVRF